MKIALMYNYNLTSPFVYRTNNKINIRDNSKHYILMPIHSNDELSEVYKVLKDTETQYYDKIVLTKSHNITFTHMGAQFALLEKNNFRNSIEEIIFNKTIIPNNRYLLDKSNWYFLWSKKNNYIEYQYIDNNQCSKVIQESIDYYLGMAETALAYLKYEDTQKKDNNLTISHRRINDYEITNPLNIIIDTKERDISEYLKYLFITKNNSIEKIKKVMRIAKINELSHNKIYARLLYPTYYFDLCDQEKNNIKVDNKITEFIKRIDEYEIYLRDIFNVIKENGIKIKKIDWI